jgi:hypothetical protein
MTMTNFPNGITSFGIPALGSGMVPFPLGGTPYFCNPATGSDGNDGTSPESAVATLYRAHALCTAGKNDTVFLIGDGSTTGTARLSTALAQSIDSSATSGVLTWSKNATHLIGITAPAMVSQRARIAPPSGTYTQSTFGSGNFLVVSGSGCLFANFSMFHGFSTGGTNQICTTVTGSRNAFVNVHMGGMGDQASADDAGSRSLKIGSDGSGENLFDGCVIGLDTVTRGAANASVEFAGATPRNAFRNCLFPFMTDAATPLGILTAGAAALDRWQLFDGCSFINNVDSTSTVMTALATMAASSGGLILLKNSVTVGMTDLFSDATTAGQMYIDMPAPSNSAGGLGVAPA